MNNKKEICNRFSAAASTYDQHALLQTHVAGKVIEMLGSQAVGTHLLDVGCGTGILTERIVNLLPEAEVTAVDISAEMVQIAKNRLEKVSNINWSVSDIVEMSSAKSYDLVISSAALHWVFPIEDAFISIKKLMTDNGRFVFSVMIEGSLLELREARERVSPNKAVGGILPSSDLVIAALESAGWRIVGLEEESLNYKFSSASDLLKVLHEQGLTGGILSASGSRLNRSELRNLVEDYDSNYRLQDGRVYASYRVLYIDAEKVRND